MESSQLFSDFVEPVQPPAKYIGGKRRLAAVLTRAIDRTPHDVYAEVFVGMGGVFLRRSRRPKVEIINDWSEDVSTFFRILQRHYVAFMDMLRFQMTTRAGFERLIKIDPSTQTDLERAARFLYLQRLAFGGTVSNRSFGVDPGAAGRFDVTKLAPLLERIHERLAPVTIERLPWADFLKRYDREDALFYLDPPYYGCEGDYGKELFGREQFPIMAEALSGLKAQFIMSLNDRAEVRDIFGGFAIAPIDLLYSVGGRGQTQEVTEVVISNMDAERLRGLIPSDNRASAFRLD